MKSTNRILTISLPYFVIAIFLFFIEVFIALKVKDRFVRPYLGDYLVVMLVYCSIKAFFRISYLKAAIITLLFSYLVETLQYFQFVNILGPG